MHSILGQDSAINMLSNQVSSGRTHHSYIFHGLDGVGKFTTALGFAKLLLCTNKQNNLAGAPEACGQCESCKYFNSDISEKNQEQENIRHFPHPDLHVVTKEMASASSVATVRSRKQITIPVDLLRELIVGGTTSDGKFHDAPAYKSAQLDSGKVFIIDEAHLLNPSGQNILLKTLEEPPQGTRLILVTSSEDKLLPTIRSRCQRISFLPLSNEIVKSWIDKNSENLTDKQRLWLIDFAAGSIGKAGLALDNNLISWANDILLALEKLTSAKPAPNIGLAMETHIKEFAELQSKKNANASKDAANKLAANLMWSMISEYARKQLYNISGSQIKNDFTNYEQYLNPWLNVIDAVQNTQRLLAANVNLSLCCSELSTTMHRHLTC